MIFPLLHRGQGIIEYALLLVFIALLVIVLLAILGTSLGDVFSNLISTI